MTNNIFTNKEKFFDLWAPNYDCLFTTVLYQAVHKRLLEYVELPDQPNVLDLGCGTGRLLNRLAAQFPTLQGTGLDLSGKMIREARQCNQHGVRLIYIRGNAESLPFAKGQFDAVFNTISFLHYPNPEQVFSEVSRVLRPKGCFYLVDYVRADISPGYFPFFGGLRLYSPQQREQLGIGAGLECLGHHYLLGLILLTIFSKVQDLS
ncbi:MAG: class I SAM-dependent methyltransferase [Xenococcaceae cyanobacterium]